MGADSCAARPMKQRSVKALSDGNTEPKSHSPPGHVPVEQHTAVPSSLAAHSTVPGLTEASLRRIHAFQVSDPHRHLDPAEQNLAVA